MAKQVVRKKVAKQASSPRKSAAPTKTSATKPLKKAAVKKPSAAKTAAVKTGAAKAVAAKAGTGKTAGPAGSARKTAAPTASKPASPKLEIAKPVAGKPVTAKPGDAKPAVAAGSGIKPPAAALGAAATGATATSGAKPGVTAPTKPASAPGAGKSESREKPLGRPLVTAEEKLYMVFKDDYHARQVFEFLRVETVGELERYSPQQIISLLSAPVRRTVERIRDKLAGMKRALRDDIEYAKERQKRPDKQ